MSLLCWKKLGRLLTPIIGRKYYNSISSQIVDINIIMGIGMRWLCGGHVNDLKLVYGVSMTEVHKCIDQFIYYVNKCEEWEIKIP